MKVGNLIVSVAFVCLICTFLSTPVIAKQNTIIDGQVHNMSLPKAVPGQLNYQGYLASAADTSAVTATLEMTFRLFDAETKGAELWSETHATVEISDGLFQVLLGSVTSFPTNLFDGSLLWLQTEVGTEILVPRKPLVSAAYSQMAEMADHAATADWATDAQNAVHADTADHCPGVSAWTVSGDDVYRETGKVGIGTTSPLTELDVTGSVNATTYYGDGSNLTGISGTTDNDWTIDGNDIYHETGKVGIGTLSPSQALHIAGHELIQGPDGFTSSGEEATLYLGDTNKYLRATYGGNTTLISNDPLRFHCGVDTSQFYLNVFGSVGVGTDSPGQKLDVNGAVKATTYYGDGSNLTGISGTTDNDWTISAPDIYFALGGKVGIGVTHPTTKLEVDGSVKATTYFGNGSNLTDINDGDWIIGGDDVYHDVGNVGIGTLSPSGKLDVHGTIKAVADDGPHFIIHDSNGSNDRPGIQFTNNNIQYIGGDDDDDEYFEFYSLYGQTRSYDAHLRVHGKATSDWGNHIDLTHDGTDAIISTDAGDIVLSPAVNVGIGTSSPAQKLVIEGAGPKLALNTTNTSATALYFQESGSSKWSIAYAPGSDYLYFYDFTKGGTRMVLQDGTGYVGIRTGSPTAPLDVNGTAKADTIKVDHDLIVTGAYKGTIGPNNGAPFPRPAYDTGWQSISPGIPLIIPHSIGGDIDDYVVEMSVNGGTSNEHLFTGAVYWSGLSNSTMTAYRKGGDTTVSTVRIRIWMYN